MAKHGPEYWANEAAKAAREEGIPVGRFVAQMSTESIGFRDDVIHGRTASPAGAQGIAQFMPATARGLGVDPLKPRQALRAAAKLMKGYIAKYGDDNALRAYNAGPGGIAASHGYAETNHYVNTIRQNASKYAHLGAGAGSSPAATGGRGTPGTPALTVAGYKAQNMPAAAPASEAVQALSAQLAAAGSQSVGASAPAAPSFAASAVGPGGQRLSVPTVAPAPAAPRVADQLAAAAGLSGPTTQNPDVPALKIPGTPGSGGGAGGGGPVLVVGDSLGVGTAPVLKQRIGRKVDAVVKGGISSAVALKAARQQIQSGRYGTIVFDLGTNDPRAHDTVESLRQLLRMAPDAQIVVPTLNGPYDTARKNRALRAIAAHNPNVTLVRWHKASQGGATLADGIHGDYGKRAALIAAALGGGSSTRAGGQRGTLKIVGPNPGRVSPMVVDFGERVAGVLGKPLTASDGTGHSYRTATGSVSEHTTGHAVDIPMRGAELLAAGRAALIAAGMPRAKAMKVKGGLFNLYETINGRRVRHQIIFNDYAQVSGSPHTDHLHISAAYHA